MSYALHCRCINCDARKDHAPFSAAFENKFFSSRFCEACGESCGFYDSKEIWVDDSRPLKPWTWFCGHWEKVDRLIADATDRRDNQNLTRHASNHSDH
ncbi:hypothetical protein [Pseudomonas sp. BJa3]|uniref:hypothetical protein n=1 Tax=Pseudomonas sp. BJa3 TaxID=2986525 RepID=UPI002265D3BD|nr:hypothetical protein [Pseudomonas sp. BJa3]MCX5508347.1 hypothetical protein [Pseudomonas sp. BJa3]